MSQPGAGSEGDRGGDLFEFNYLKRPGPGGDGSMLDYQFTIQTGSHLIFISNLHISSKILNFSEVKYFSVVSVGLCLVRQP